MLVFTGGVKLAWTGIGAPTVLKVKSWKCGESNGVAEKVLHSSVSLVNPVVAFRVLLAMTVSVFFIFLHSACSLL